ncbi:unnamed protein product [Vicia faba]|uniref:Uncharacterized protein n=1 Tax=Vicia faba TaxID=3906 RepID=A0AAV0ZMN4_VICFA|nr:unnamed protein product [Vicia faba]
MRTHHYPFFNSADHHPLHPKSPPRHLIFVPHVLILSQFHLTPPSRISFYSSSLILNLSLTLSWQFCSPIQTIDTEIVYMMRKRKCLPTGELPWFFNSGEDEKTRRSKLFSSLLL